MPPSTSASPAAAIEHATPTSPWQPDLGAADRRVHLVEHADRGGREQERRATPSVVGARDEARVVVQHRRDDAGGAVRRRGDDAAARRVLLVHRQGPEVHPIERGERRRRRPTSLRRRS